MSKHVRVFIGVALVLLTLFPVILTAGWLKYYGKEDTTEIGYCMVYTDDAGYIMSACAHEEQKLWVVKTDSEGDAEWDAYYSPGTFNTGGNCIRKTADGGYIVAGSGFKLLKISETGDSSWAYLTEDRYYPLWTEQTSDGGYIVIGNRDTTFGAEGYASRIWLFKTDPSGVVQWERLYGIHESDSIYLGFCVQQASDGNYIACGSWMYDLWLAKIDSTGDTLWSKTYPELGYGAYSVRETSDGGFIMCGYASTEDGLLVVKTDSAGVVEWSSTYGGMSVTGEDIRQTPGGDYVLAGIYHEDVDKWDVLVQRLSSIGEIQWTKIYGDTLHKERAYSIELTADGGYAVGGSIYWDNPGPGHQHDHYDVLLLKLDANGDTVTTYVSETAPQPVSGLAVSSPIGSFVLLSSHSEERSHLGIYDASGRLVDELLLDGPGTVIWGSDFEPGVYFIVPQTGNQSAHKVVLVR